MLGEPLGYRSAAAAPDGEDEGERGSRGSLRRGPQLTRGQNRRAAILLCRASGGDLRIPQGEMKTDPLSLLVPRPALCPPHCDPGSGGQGVCPLKPCPSTCNRELGPASCPGPLQR